MTRRIPRRLASALVAALAVLLWHAASALAHVSVDPQTAGIGSETVFTFRVPDERDAAGTVRLVIAMPTNTPIPVVSLRPLAGWTAQVTTRKLTEPVGSDDGPIGTVVSRITWTADDKRNAIGPGQFQEFTIEAGPLPRAKLLVFKVLQYYSDGTVERWIDPPKLGDPLPHPAPAVTLTDGATAARSEPAASGGVDWIPVAAFVAGLLGLAAGTSALVRVRHGGNRRSVSPDRK
ncbi:MAG TPA: YcnI family protein [Jatrophihabitans sp.]|nr:YcnI family protein [Jatrophihabitans sp.]